MTIKALGARDHRIDFLRGFALISIFINHIPGNALEPLTLKNYGLSDSAELFVLLAGMAAAFAYFPRFIAGNRMLAIGKAVKRSGTLYVAHLASTAVGLAVFSVGAVFFARTELLTQINIQPFLDNVPAGLIGFAALTHQLGYHNILPMYVVLLLMLPIIMLAASFGLRWLATLSIGFFILTQYLRLNLPNYPTTGGWFFNPLAWQIIFVMGFIVGVRILRGESPMPYNRYAWWAGVGYLIWACTWHKMNLYGSIPEIPLIPHQFQINEKPWVAFPRLMHIISISYVVGHSGLMGWIGERKPSNPLILMGQSALPIFWFCTVLSMVGQVYMAVASPTPTEQVTYIGLGFLLMWAIAYALDWLSRAEKSRQKKPVPA